ncbi:response regulator transcription factor [Sinomonas sp. P47F7]|uniref:response regulator transcription factor n=1 Tax=Sinomonas sp. P47F7 TaxID=3410987 RepID=UPI003BF47581
MPDSRTAVVIEDDDDVRGLIGAVLLAAGLQVHAAASGGNGISAVREHQPDLIILDYGLPDVDGLSVAESLREFTTAPILLLTAREDLVAAGHAAITDAMSKPFQVTDLSRRAQALLGRT